VLGATPDIAPDSCEAKVAAEPVVPTAAPVPSESATVAELAAPPNIAEPLAGAPAVRPEPSDVGVADEGENAVCRPAIWDWIWSTRVTTAA
jgi:hypothetical protein